MARKDRMRHMNYCNFCSFVLSRSPLTILRLKLYLWCTRHHKAGKLLEKWCFINKCWLHKTQLIYMLVFFFFLFSSSCPPSYCFFPFVPPVSNAAVFLHQWHLSVPVLLPVRQAPGVQRSRSHFHALYTTSSLPLFIFVCFCFSHVITFYLTYNTYKPKLSAFVSPALGPFSATFVSI